MIAVIQRVSRAEVVVNDTVTGNIGTGIVVLLGVERGDSEAEADYLAKKTVDLRIFPDEADRMNRSLRDIAGEVLVISQFTLLGDCRKGRRPNFTKAADAVTGNRLYLYFVERLRQYGITVQTGIFGAMMYVSLINDGPVTLILDSRKWVGERIVISAES